MTLVSISVNPAPRSRDSSLVGALGSLYCAMASKYSFDQCRKACSGLLVGSVRARMSDAFLLLVGLQLTFCQRPIVRLCLEVYLGELAPSAWPQDAVDVPHITPPPTRVDSPSDHLAVDKVKLARVKSEPVSLLSVSHPFCLLSPGTGPTSRLHTFCSGRLPESRDWAARLRGPNAGSHRFLGPRCAG